MANERIPFHIPQWFVVHQRGTRHSDGGQFDNGLIIWCSEKDIDARKASIEGSIGYIGCGNDVHEALVRAKAVSQFGGWEHHERVDVGDVENIEISASDAEMKRIQALIPVRFETGPTLGIRGSDIESLQVLADAGIAFTAEASSVTEADMWPKWPEDGDDEDEDEIPSSKP